MKKGGSAVTSEEKTYRSTVNRLACSLLVFLGLFVLFSVFILFFGPATQAMADVRKGEILYQTVYGLLYAAVFCLPVFFFSLISRRKPHEEMKLSFTLPRETPLYLFAGIAVILGCAYLNSLLLAPFSYNEFIQEATEQDVTANYQLVLALFTTAVVPGFVEEFLFRGLVLNQLLPYGRTTAVVASALLFGAMHQNAGQFFYATAAGLVLGVVYVKTKSLWCGVLLHFSNNAYSVLESAVAARLPEASANRIIIGMEAALFALGLFSFVVLALRQRDGAAAVRRTGTFETVVEADAEWCPAPIAPARRVRLFFSVPMILFLAACALSMAALMVLAGMM